MEKRITFCGHSPGPGTGVSQNPKAGRIFLLSPANLKGIRADQLFASRSDLGVRLRSGRATLAEVFCFASSLYFRGKLSYAQKFATPLPGLEGSYVITSSRGLLAPETLVDVTTLRSLRSDAELDPDDERYRAPLERDARRLRERLGGSGSVVLLGSVATPKYVRPLLEVFGQQLLFPALFAGLGNMSRGGLLLRCVREGRELAYVNAAGL